MWINTIFIRSVVAVAVLGTYLPALCFSQGAFLKTSHVIDDEPRGYCLDVAGFGAGIQLDAELRMHTCKYGEVNDDQLFQWIDDASDHISLPAYDRCLATGEISEGAKLFVRPCSNSELQSWNIMPNGQVKPHSRPDLCVTLADSRNYAGAPPWLSPVYHWRPVTLEKCAESAQARQNLRWGHPEEQARSFADTLGRQMPADIAAAIAGFGNRLGISAETRALYADQPRVYELGELDVVDNLAYGPDERHRLSVHTDKFRRDSEPMPVVVFFHGGAFIRGNLDGNRNVADYFASLGLVGVNATYRLTPAAKWPDGALDVGAAVTWVRDNIAEYGGDPEQIIVIGKSAGAAHVATYAFLPDLLPSGTAKAAGAVLISGIYGVDEQDTSEGNLAYYGEDLSRYTDMSVPDNISRTDIPVLMIVSEYDPPAFGQSMAKLLYTLTIDYDQLPRVAQLVGHNHYSSNIAIGTQDTRLSAEILEFIHLVAKLRPYR